MMVLIQYSSEMGRLSAYVLVHVHMYIHDCTDKLSGNFTCLCSHASRCPLTIDDVVFCVELIDSSQRVETIKQRAV